MSAENLGLKAKEALRQVINFIMSYGRVPSVRELMITMNYKSPRSAALLLEELEENGFLEKKDDGTYKLLKDIKDNENAQTVAIPLLGTVTCGRPILAEENIEAFIPVSISIARPGGKYFMLKAKGDSMNEAGINEGDLILVKQQSTAENGQNVVALIDDEATVKEYQQRGKVVILYPRSTNKAHQPIILDHEFQIQGIVIAAIPVINI
ncbi:transcriptional repressor LexA [Paraflavisolibacter sp. H34]|uniref:transcriptional repressor LexA n=1 Tax=Huijunlia imazamoxiresistens TaxID=3127457 RepID=UPI00301B41F1